MNRETIAAIATALSDSGIGIVRISGEDAISIADSCFVNKYGKRILKNVDSHTLHYGYIVSEDCDETSYKEYIVDEVMVAVMKAPRSFTTENTVEINCHGGVLVVQKVLETVLKCGARIAEPGEFTKRAFLNGRIDLSKAEAVIDVIHSQNEYALKSSVNQLKGDLSDCIKKIREKLIYEIAFIESALDDPEHISLDGYPENLKEKLEIITEEIQKLIATANDGKIIKEGIKTVIIGKPNAGKSSLLNVILGEERAIVTDIAGTTRDVLQENVRLHGINLNIIDTAGIRNTQDMVEKIGVDKAKQSAYDADLILYVVDSSVDLNEDDSEILKLIQDKKCIILMNKSDLEQKISKEEILKKLSAYTDQGENIPFIKISAKNHVGMEEFENKLKEMFLQGHLKNNNQLLITNMRHKEALENTYESLKLVLRSIEDDMPEDFYSIDLMSAYSYLGRIIGEEVDDDLVEEIFSKFCMGK